MRAIATPPHQPTIYVALTAEEEVARAAEEAAEVLAKPLRDWEVQMAGTDSTMPRYVEDIIDALDAPTRAALAAFTLDNYNAKKTLRATKPA